MAVIPISLASLPPQLRPINILHDLPAIANLVETCFTDTLDDDGRRYLQQMRRSGSDNAFLRWALRVVDTVSLPLSGFVWDEAGEIIGNASLIPYRRDRHKIFLIANVAVHPNHRRGGIGRVLTEAAMQQAHQKGSQEIWLHVRSDNPGAIQLYENLGFQERFRRTSWLADLDRNKRPEEPAQKATRRRERDWEQQEVYLRRSYPESLAWYQPLPWSSLRAGLFHSLERFLLADATRHWVIHAGRELAAALTWQPSQSGYPDRLWAAVPPSGGEEPLQNLLLHARHVLTPWRHSLSLEFPQGECTDAILSAGFVERRTLLWMQLKDRVETKE